MRNTKSRGISLGLALLGGGLLGGVQPASAAPKPDVNGDGVYDHKDAFIIGQRRNRYPRFFNCVN
jgi:hypothetical protein